MPVLDLNPDQLLTTTRSVRNRLDFDRPVERETLEDCVRIATQAPSGGNSQKWHWVFVTDPERKEAIAEHYKVGFVATYGPEVVPEMTDLEKKMWRSASFLAENFHRVPVMTIPCQWKRIDNAPHPEQAAYWGSLLPAVWSFMLALRARGLG